MISILCSNKYIFRMNIVFNGNSDVILLEFNVLPRWNIT